jgi:polysaccharide pyruvyl transferase WcaK-like protein
MKKRIVVAGIEFAATNLGCGALAYSFLNLLEEIAMKNDCEFELSVITYDVPNEQVASNKNISIEYIYRDYKKIEFYIDLINKMKKSDLFIDFTEGDSFTDIYGIKRFIITSAIKECAVLAGIDIMYGPQTYGPYLSKISKIWARHLLRKAKRIFSRDDLSTDLLHRYKIHNVCTVTDIAMLLPYQNNEIEYNEKRIGINVSALLWNGGYNHNNQFKLMVDYRQYTFEVIEYLLRSNYEVHLIPHVITNDYDNCENDYKIAEELYIKYPQLVLPSKFKNPIEAKSYISSMSWFVGARMHSTIGAISSGVKTIPFSYSRKFEGLYKSLNYDYCISGQILSTSDAVEMTIECLECASEIEENVKNAQELIMEKSNYLKDEFKNAII